MLYKQRQLSSKTGVFLFSVLRAHITFCTCISCFARFDFESLPIIVFALGLIYPTLIFITVQYIHNHGNVAPLTSIVHILPFLQDEWSLGDLPLCIFFISCLKYCKNLLCVNFVAHSPRGTFLIPVTSSLVADVFIFILNVTIRVHGNQNLLFCGVARFTSKRCAQQFSLKLQTLIKFFFFYVFQPFYSILTTSRLNIPLTSRSWVFTIFYEWKNKCIYAVNCYYFS